MDTPSLADTMEAEKQRLNKVLETIAEKRVALDQEERAAKIELAGISAYLDAKLGKVMTLTSAPKKRAVQGTRAPRQGGIKDRVLAVVTAAGISKQDILNALNAGDDKSLQQAISNALVALKKDNKVVSGERGMYKLPEAAPPADPTPPTPKRVKKEDAPAAQA